MNWRRAWAALAVVLACLLHAGAHAQAGDCPRAPRTPSADEAASVAREAQDRGFLWRITKDGRTSWLYGTIHLGRLAWVYPGPRVRAALRASDVAAFELDVTDPALVGRLQEALRSAARDPSAPALPADLVARLERQLRVACAPPAMREAMPPEILGTMLMMMAARHDGLDAAYGIDPALAVHARREGKAVVSLETPQLQIDAILSRTPDDLRASMEKILDDLEQGRARPLLARMARVWEEGRDEELARYREWCDCADTPRERALLRSLLDDRNKPMAERLDALHASGRSVFAAVGSLHMFGPSSLPELMAARGYEVTRITLRP